MRPERSSGVGLVCVDDDSLMLEFIERRLKDHREHLRCFSEPLQAIEYLAQQEVRTILVDWRMPAMDGIEFFATLAARGANASARKVLYSAMPPGQGTRDAAAALGAETLDKDRVRDGETLRRMLL